MYLNQADDKCCWNTTVRSMVAVVLQLLVTLLLILWIVMNLFMCPSFNIIDSPNQSPNEIFPHQRFSIRYGWLF